MSRRHCTSEEDQRPNVQSKRIRHGVGQEALGSWVTDGQYPLWPVHYPRPARLVGWGSQSPPPLLLHWTVRSYVPYPRTPGPKQWVWASGCLIRRPIAALLGLSIHLCTRPIGLHTPRCQSTGTFFIGYRSCYPRFQRFDIRPLCTAHADAPKQPGDMQAHPVYEGRGCPTEAGWVPCSVPCPSLRVTCFCCGRGGAFAGGKLRHPRHFQGSEIHALR